MRAILLPAVLLVVLSSGGAAASIDCLGDQPYSALVVGQKLIGAPVDTWTYTVTNCSTVDTYVLWLIAIEVGSEANVVGATAPDGWSVDFVSQPHFVTWMKTMGEVAAGESQSGFIMKLDAEPSYQMYSAMFTNTEDPGQMLVDYGDVVTTPEPGGLAILLVAIAPLGLRMRRR